MSTTTELATLRAELAEAERQVAAARDAFMASAGRDPLTKSYLHWLVSVRDYDRTLAAVAAELPPNYPPPGRTPAASVPPFGEGLQRAMDEASRRVLAGETWPPD